MAAVEPARNGQQPPTDPKLTNGFGAEKLGREMSDVNGIQFPSESNGGGPPGGYHPAGQNNYGPYGHGPQGYPVKGPPGGGYPGPYGPGGGQTPTLNSLLQERRYTYDQSQGGPPPQVPGGTPPRGPGEPPGGYQNWGYGGHPGFRGQTDVDYLPMDGGDFQDSGAVDTPVVPVRGTGRKRGRPKGSGRGRAAKGTSPSPSPIPVGPRPPYGYSSPGAYPYRSPGYQGDPRYPGEPHGYPPSTDRGFPPPQGVQGPYPGGESSEGGPPPPPGKHEGPPAATWTPPVQPRRKQGQNSSGPPSDRDGGRSPSEDGRPGSTEPGVGGGPSPRPRPSPSPTGSSSSRSMSPAVREPPPRPASGHNTEGNGPMSTAMASPAPGPNYPGQPNMGPPPHMYKGHPPGPGQPPYGYPGYGPPRPGYGAPGPYPGYPPARNNSPGPPPPGQYPGYPPYPPQGWNGQNAGGKGGPPAQGPPGAPRHPSMPPQPGLRMGGPGYMPGQKGGYPSAPPNSYNGPQFNGPSMMPPGASGPPNMGPAPSSSPGYSTPLPPSSTPTPTNSESETVTTNSSSGSLVTTGPDGQPIHDDTSQQSTLSQSSDNSGGRQTPKGGYGQGYGGAPGTPHSAPSPGSLGSSQDDPYQRDVGSPGHGWGRVPPSPVGTPGPQAKVDNLQRLYDIDDQPERRGWLDKLLGFMEERGTPITQCPTISKNPLDLYRLYMYTKDRGGFLECTNKKAWKDIAAQLGIGPSSSGAYTLKKHYGKNLLPFECHFERGGIDPAPILAQVEAQSKKKGKGAAQARAPSPGSQDSHDSMSGSQDGYGGYPPPGGYNNYPPQDPRQGPPHQGGYPGGSYPPGTRPSCPDGYGGPGAPHYPYPGQGPPRWGPGAQYDGAAPPSGGAGGDYNRWAGYPPRPGYPASAPPTSSAGGPTPPSASQPFDYQKAGSPGNGALPPGGPSPGPPGVNPSGPRMLMRPSLPQGPPHPSPQNPSHPVILRANSPATPGTIQDTLPPALPVQRIPNPHGYAPNTSQGGGMPPPGGLGYPPISKPSGPPASGVPPPPGAAPPNRAPYPPSQYPPSHRPMYPDRGACEGGPPTSLQGPPSWNNRYPTAPGPSYPPSTGPPRPGAPPAPWPEQRSPYGPQYAGQGPWPPRSSPRPGYRPDMRGPQTSMSRPMGPGRREIYNFPAESLECTQPLLIKRKKLNKTDVQPVDGWRLVMALKSGLLMESTWALDTLNILLYDDNSVTYFGLSNMPGLLEVLIEHWRASLIAMFDLTRDLEISNDKAENNRKRKRDKMEKSSQGVKWFEKLGPLGEEEAGLGCVDGDLLRCGDKVRILHHQPRDYTQESRFSEKEFQVDDKEDQLFVDDEEKDWDDVILGFTSGPDLWEAGGGDCTDHVVSGSSMIPDIRLPFVRVLKDGKEEKVGPLSPLKKEAEGAPKTSETSPGKKHGKRVREEWKVSPKSEERPHACVSGTNSTSAATSGASSNNSSSNSSNTSAVPSSNTCRNNSNTSTDVKSEPIAVKTESEEELVVPPPAATPPAEDVIESLRCRTGIIVLDEETVRRRWRATVLEEENYQPDQASLNLVTEAEDTLGRRAVCVSTIFRNLSFVPGNEVLLGNSPGFLAVCGKVILHAHWHPERSSKQRNYDKGDEEDYSDSCTSLMHQKEWWWEHLEVIRENVMVALSNVAGFMDLTPLGEHIVMPLLSGLLEWAVSPAAVAQDAFNAAGQHSNISPQRLAIETLCKLCITEGNVDLVLSTPPYSRLEQLCSFLSRKLYRSEDQVMREFAINLLFYFSGADSGVARTIALQDTTVSLLIGFIEQAENNAMVVAQQHGVNALRDNPDSMGTSLDMLRRAANTLNNLSKHEDNRPIFVRHEQRLLNLVMSQILDQGVAGIVSQVIFQISRET